MKGINIEYKFIIEKSQSTIFQDITSDWALIRSTASDVLESYGIVASARKRVPLKGNQKKRIRKL